MRRALLLSLVLFTSVASAEVHRWKMPVESRNQSPALLADPDGTLWVAWSMLMGAHHHLAATRSTEGRSARVEYLRDGGADALEPVWLVEDGSPALLYTAQSGADASIRKRTCKDGAWSEPTTLAPGMHPTAATARGVAWMAWQRNGGIDVMPALPQRAQHPAVVPQPAGDDHPLHGPGAAVCARELVLCARAAAGRRVGVVESDVAGQQRGPRHIPFPGRWR